MKQMWIPRYGPPDVFEAREAADPVPAAGEVRVRVRASGVNFADIMARIGIYEDAPPIPFVVGYEVAGTVDAVGPDVTGIAVGDRVVALTRFGGYTDTICVPAATALRLPDAMSFEQGAAIPVQYLTAWIMLVHLGNVRAGDKVLVHAAAGGFGLAAAQICRWKGATVFGTASPGKHDRLREMGVAHPIDYRSQDFEAEVMRLTDDVGVDIVLDAQAGDSFAKSYRCLATMGRLFLFGGAKFVGDNRKKNLLHLVKTFLKTPKYKPFDLMSDNRGVIGVNIGHMWHLGPKITGMLSEIMGLCEDGTFSPTIDKTFPLADVAQAHEYIQARKNFGKVLLTS